MSEVIHAATGSPGQLPRIDGQPRRHVLRLITRLNVGGPARHALLLTKGLVDGYTTTLAAGTPTAAEGELSDPDVPVLRVPLVRQIDPASDVRSLLAIRRLLAREQPLIVHTHMAKAGTIGRLAALATTPRPRTVHTFHGHVLEGYFGPAVTRAVVEAERALARRTDRLIAVSKEIRDQLLGLGIGHPSQIEVVSLGLDLAGFLAVDQPSGTLRRALRLAREVPLVGIVGRLVPIKDHVTAFKALCEVPHAHLAVIGDGERRRQLEAAVVDLGIAHRVHFLGWSFDLPALVSDLDVVLLTSRNEGTPVALIEAGAAARAVVATDVGGVRSVVEDGRTGLLVPSGDAHAAANAIARLLENADLRRRLGEAARERVRDAFGRERLLADMRALYDDLLGLPSSRTLRALQ